MDQDFGAKVLASFAFVRKVNDSGEVEGSNARPRFDFLPGYQ